MKNKFYLIIRRLKIKKILSIVIGIILVATVFEVCSKVPVNDDSNLESDNSATIQDEAPNENDFEYPTEQPSQNSNPRTYKRNVIMSFNAVQGAVIYDQSYDLNGYLESCQYYPNRLCYNLTKNAINK